MVALLPEYTEYGERVGVLLDEFLAKHGREFADLKPHVHTIRRFCGLEEVILTNIDRTNEREIDEPILYFSDNLGGYLIDALQNHLREVYSEPKYGSDTKTI
ncbi:MAG: hypothetical protein ACMXYF_04125 [Candidatus Woesearchaeota archaeon]